MVLAYQQVLFDAFSQEKPANTISRQSGGIGLGLTISKNLSLVLLILF